jgi:hypothetical protein
MLQDITELPITMLQYLSNLHRFFGKIQAKVLYWQTLSITKVTQ